MRAAVAASLFVVAGVHTGLVFACATCLCGDPTISTMGTEKPFAGRLRGSVDFLSRKEVVGQPSVNEHEIEEKRVTYSMSYSPSQNWTFLAALPVVEKKVARFDLSSETGGPALGDADLFARWYVSYEQTLMAPELWGLQFGLRVPTSTEQKASGVPLSFDAQPGAGATIPSFGLWYGRYATPWFFYTSATYQRAVTTGYQGYQAGDTFLATGYTQYALEYKFALSFSLDARSRKKDRYFEVPDPDSGGLLVMATPGLVWTPVTDLVVYAAVQIPAVEKLNGYQDDKRVFRIGVSYDF
jgi:hypothetical protein